MSVLQQIDNIKIPYPTEGVIRTAQLDDTIAPVNSVQLAVNMNFDRVGAMQTRPGVTSYADDLVDAINNYGTLHNELIPDGYAALFPLGAINDLALSMNYASAVKVSNTRISVFWSDASSHGQCQNFDIDETTGAITPIGTAVEFESSSNSNNRAILITSSLTVLNVWTGPSGDGYVQAFIVSTDNVTPVLSALEFDTSNGENFSLAKIDSTHFICFYRSSSDDGVATVFEVNAGTLAVTQPGSPTTYDSGVAFDNSCVALGDGIHFVNFWANVSTGGNAQCFSVNTGTWAITAIGSPLVFSTNGRKNSAVTVGDGQHMVDVYSGDTSHVEAQCFSVNLSTFAVTKVGTLVEISSSSGNQIAAVGFGDGQHFVAFYDTGSDNGFVQMIAMNPSTFDMSNVGLPLSGYTFPNNGSLTAVDLTNYKVAAIWSDDVDQGKGAMFVAFGDVVEGRWLYAGSGDEVFNTPAPGGTWTSRRSGLAQVSKSRFAQYLNYIWMVNGNQFIGGDPVATSNGGNFGTDLVPDNFPRGDFIQAGFEGRVWVFDKTLGVVYYTDIVQFQPPNVYTLTFNEAVNFITTLAPQTGETFTAVFQVPRALLVFTQNTITRIYGATSVDAYPAYNVGTFSQESIIQTKTGIFFHHSSGFYQFDYGSQPVEISRRIIDFVQAIPRSYYEDITGVWDGFDNVEWSIGQVIVEGVVFANCVVRYTISTQVWTIYDYVGNEITAMIFFDDGETLNHIMGTEAGKTAAMDVGFTDLGEPFYYEFIDRWRSYANMYYLSKNISGFAIYTENAAGANLSYQAQKSGPNAWLPLGTVDEQNTSILPNSGTEDFDVMRLRLAGNTKGAQVVVHGIEITSVNILGQDQN